MRAVCKIVNYILKKTNPLRHETWVPTGITNERQRALEQKCINDYTAQRLLRIVTIERRLPEDHELVHDPAPGNHV